jgi:acylphosphatase
MRYAAVVVAMKRLTATVTGYVQGVAFRANTQQEASRLGLTGWVKNHWDGSVKVVAEGPESALDRLAVWLEHGPRAARVESVDKGWSEASGEFHGFSIRY